ncbi:MAG TPA: alkaline phosphatase family protein [Dermatophilaceae bacterium]
MTNEAAGTLSVIDLQRGVKLADITVGPRLSHPQGVVVDAAGARAYVAISASDEVAVVDLKTRTVERTISVGRPAGLGTMPVALTLDPTGDRLFVAESGADEIAAIRLPGSSGAAAPDWTVVGRIPTADQPQAVVTVAAQGRRPAQLMYVAAEGVGVGPNPLGTNPVLPSDPIFWAFNPIAPKVDVFNGEQYPPALVTGRAGLMSIPTYAQISRLTPAASRQLQPTDAQPAPADTPLRADGPIKHVFFVVRENRSYDQMLGDDTRGNGDPKLTVFGKNVTPNMHALVTRFPLMDNVYANSEASIQGHYWTASAGVPDYVNRNWVQQYASRGRPNDFGVYAVTWPGNGFLFDQAERQHISYFHYGEGMMGGYSSIPDRDRSAAQLAEVKAVEANSDIGPPTSGCYPSDLTIGQALDGNLKNPLTGEIFDSRLPAGAPKGSHSHMDCFSKRFASQLAAGAVPTFSYLTMTSDHTRGTQPGFPIPNAMVADSDQALGQLVQTISHSSIWSSSAIFVVEDDSQDGADHVNAHRIPALVISPYARQGAVIHRRYDLVSVVRSIELILGMKPLTLNDAMAAPMYDAFTAKALNNPQVTAIPSRINLLTRNGPAAPDSQWSSTLALGQPDRVPQWQLDQILWHSVHGAGSSPPPPGPGAAGEAEHQTSDPKDADGP